MPVFMPYCPQCGCQQYCFQIFPQYCPSNVYEPEGEVNQSEEPDPNYYSDSCFIYVDIPNLTFPDSTIFQIEKLDQCIGAA